MKTERTVKNRKGVSLIEILVTMFIFTLIMTSSIAAFSTFFKTRKTTREIQRGLEESRAALETMAKNIRMSSKLAAFNADGSAMICSPVTGCECTRIIMFNNTQKQCIVYEFSGSPDYKLRGKFVTPATIGTPPKEDPDSCVSRVALLAPAPLVDDDNIINEGTVTGSFYVFPTTPVVSIDDGKIGRAAMKIDVISGSVTSHIQTTVSFRDFEGELY